MQLFFTERIENNLAILEAEESRHCIQVLRKKVGDEVVLVDGQGSFYKARISEIQKRSCTLDIVSISKQQQHRKYKIHLAIAPPKNPKRFDWLLEKLTEIGIDRISPLLCARSERVKLNGERMRKTLISAIKQSGQAQIPHLGEMIKFKDFISSELEQQKYVAWVSDEHQSNLSSQYINGEDVCILIGPEGDFTPEEIDSARKAGFLPTSLGENRLRTETAGLTCVQTIHALNFMV